MRLLAIVILAFPVLFSTSCTLEKFSNCYKGRLENIPNCGAPVIKILEGDLAGIEHETWQNPANNETHENVFVVKNFCDFYRANIEEGDEFYFVVESSMGAQSCIICSALFPVPSKTNIIKVVRERACE